MRGIILLLALLAQSCSTRPSNTANEQQVITDPCAWYLGMIEQSPEVPTAYFRKVENAPMDTVDFWHLYRNGVQVASPVVLDSTSVDDCLMAAYFDDTGGFADSLHIIHGSRRLLSIAGIKSRIYLNGVYPIPVRKLFELLGSTDRGNIDLTLSFSRGEMLQGNGTLRIVR